MCIARSGYIVTHTLQRLLPFQILSIAVVSYVHTLVLPLLREVRSAGRLLRFQTEVTSEQKNPNSLALFIVIFVLCATIIILGILSILAWHIYVHRNFTNSRPLIINYKIHCSRRERRLCRRIDVVDADVYIENSFGYLFYTIIR